MLQNSILRSADGSVGEWGALQSPKPAERIYRGERCPNGASRVWIESLPCAGEMPERRDLPLHLELRAHSPTGFAWGYGGSGPAQLALALLVDALEEREMAERYYQEFKRAYVEQWGERWSITADEIRFFVLSRVTREKDPAKARFAPGTIVSTPGVMARVPRRELIKALTRHLSGDWGELDEHDWRANESALCDGSRLLSAYVASSGVRFWIITESDRSATTALLPEEY